MNVLNNLNINKNELQNARIQNLATAPSNPVKGLIYFDTVDNVLKIYNGTAWQPVGVETDLSNYFNKTEVNNLLSTKADISSLSNVATSGSYNDLTDKPSIPSISGLATETYVNNAVSTKANISDVYTKTETYSKTEIDNKVSSVYKYKGSKASASALPTTGNIIGDVYNLEDTGMNVAWTGTSWDELGSNVDLSGYVTTSSLNTTLESYVTETELNNSLSGKVNTSDLSTVATSGSYNDLTNKPTILKKYSANVGNGTSAEITINHNLGSRDVQVSVYTNASPYDIVYPDIEITSTNAIKLIFATAPTSNQYKVVVIG